MKRFVAAIMALVLLSGNARATGIPVVDALSNGQRMLEFAQTLQKYQDEYLYWESELDRLKQTYDALTGVRNIGDIFDNKNLHKYLPDEWVKTYRIMKNLGYAGLVGEASAMWAVNQVFERCERIILKDKKLDCQTRAIKPTVDVANASVLYGKIIERGAQIRDLQAAINKTEDQKAILELQARLQTEQLFVESMSNQIKVAQMTMEAEERVMQQRQLEFNARTLSAKKGAAIPAEGWSFFGED